MTVVDAPAAAEKSAGNSGSDAPTTEKQWWREARRKLQLERLERLAVEKHRAEFEQLATRMLRRNPDDLEVLALRLKLLDHVKHRKTRLPEVISAADAILERIDEDELARWFGQRHSAETPAEKKTQQQMEEQKKLLIDTLYRRGRAIGYMELPDVIEKHPIADPDAHDRLFEENFARLQRWVDTTGRDYVLLHIRRERRKDRRGTAFRLLDAVEESAPPNYWYLKKRHDMHHKLGWTHLVEYDSRWLVIAFPSKAAAGN